MKMNNRVITMLDLLLGNQLMKSWKYVILNTILIKLWIIWQQKQDMFLQFYLFYMLSKYPWNFYR